LEDEFISFWTIDSAEKGKPLSSLSVVEPRLDHCRRHSQRRAGRKQLYSAFGASRYTSGSLPTSFKYTGQRAELTLHPAR
jgi:hypothetical protein